MTLVVNLFAGPGTGKSTTAADVFSRLKRAGVNAELVHEYAKDLTWEERTNALTFQPYVTAKQVWWVHRLLGKVEVIVTDSPILLGVVYRGEGYSDALEEWIFDVFRSWHTYNVFLTRGKRVAYQETGRSQTYEQALDLDTRIRALLLGFSIPHSEFRSTVGGAVRITEEILDRL